VVDIEEIPGPKLLRDLPEIRSEGTLVLLTENTSSSYYLFQGRPMGYDFELIKRFAEDHNLKFKVRVIDDLNAMFDMLNNGEGDLIACNLTITPERSEYLYFSEPIMHTRQVLVQRKPENYKSLNAKQLDTMLVRQISQLAGKKVYVHQFSTYYRRLVQIEGEIAEPINIRPAEGDFTTEDLIRMVADGEIDYTITDENQGILNAAYYRNLDVKTVLSENEPIAIAVRNNSDSLLLALNTWLSGKKTQKFNHFLEKKYFHAVNEQRSRFESDFSSLSGKKLSNWDKTIKEQSKLLGWDWRLLGAMIYHESRFDPSARSWAGAFGLMQLMPETAARFGIDTTQTEDANIVAGVKYLKFLEEFWLDKIPDPMERSKFILASYNIGPGHVQDAQFIAESEGLDSQIWDGNVEEGMRLKAQTRYAHMKGVKHGYCRGPSVAEYVRQVLLYYEQLSQTLK
jgi:membrane-bound lytic murein transglycosylase F